MKKHLCYLLALMLTLSASCSKEPAELDFSDSAQGGNHRLTELSASLDDDETRTSLQTSNNNVVYWSTKDRILVVNTTTYDSWYYELVSGVGTSVGKFEPLGEAATCNDDLSNIVAVYPAVAAVVDKAAKTLSFTVNNDWNKTDEGKKKLADCNIRSWNNDSPMTFSHNDIKVSYHVNGTANNANFKFRQLATWCNFVFNFTGIPEHKLESMESLTITTADGTKKISGTAEVDLTDPNQPTLKEGTETSIEWNTTGSLNSTTLTKSMMLFPVIDGDKLKITVKTNMNTFTFYATPTQPFTAGTVLRFPIEVGVNFEKDNAATANDFTYQVVPAEIRDFFYYGEANCLLLAGTTAAGTLDVTPYKTNAYYWNTKDDGSAAPKPAKAQVIWREAGIASMAEPTVTKNGDKYTLNVSNVQGYGNALVGIYDSSDNLLWSYHIWKPEIDPMSDANLLEYKYTSSGTYHVMPIALGAMAKVDIGPTETATANTFKTYGLYYQWGRKDPLGRSANLANNDGLVTTYSGATGTTPYSLKDKNTGLLTLLGEDGITEKEWEYSENNKEMLPIDSWMINYVTAHPTEFIATTNSAFNSNWVGKINNNLWGNPFGYDYPHKSQLHRSIFDPCPKGYRVASADLCLAFTKPGIGVIAKTDKEENYAENNFNIANRQSDGSWPSNKAATTLTTQRGYFFYYEINDDGSLKWQEGKTDFYPTSGYRTANTGALATVGSRGFYWSSAPFAEESTTAWSLDFYDSNLYLGARNNRAYGFPVRCVKEH